MSSPLRAALGGRPSAGASTAGPATARPATAIEKVVSVLEALAEHDRIKGLSEATGLPPSTTHRILNELAEFGWVHASERSYAPGPRLLALVRRIDTDRALARIAAEPVSRLCGQTGYTVHFGVRHGDVAVYAIKKEGRRAYLMRSRVGDELALHRTAIGKAILTHLPEPQVRQIAERTGLPRATAATITDTNALLEHLAEVRRRGWAMDEEENEEHTRCVGAAVLDPDGRPVGAVSLSALVFDMPVDVAHRMAGLVVAAAKDISAALSSGAH
ncbi:MAG TPA: IclR family transcriptional regulator [Pseudonocardiaceae bacterium]|jgi:IclR family acetate operon transcriptional repressor